MADSPARTTSGAPGGVERRGCGVVHRTTSESLRLGDLVPTPSLPGVPPASLQHNPRKISSFQITSVTVGGRASADGGEDSADDLDESHADDLSRVTDLDNETPSRSEDTFSRDDVFYNASASLSLGSAPVIPTSSQYGLAIVGQESEASDMRAAPGGALDTLDAKPQDTKEVQEHVRNERFKVVKIESTEPFRRGRWMCMDYLDHTTTQQSAPIVVNNNLDSAEANALTADSGVVINDIQHDELACANDLTSKELQAPPSVLQLDQKPFQMASPGQSLTQPVNLVQQMPAPVSVQSPPLEMPQQMAGQSLQASAQVGQQHAQSMTHITLQNVPPSHPQPTQPQPVPQMPQSFPQHQLQQVIAQSQGMPQMQQMTIHQQIPQQLQQIPNQAQMQQMPQHMPQNQMTNMQQMPPQISQMQTIQNQNQMQVQNQNQMQQMQMQMQGQSNPQQMHPMQQTQIPNMSQQTHHLQSQGQSMGSQQTQLQHMSSQAQLQAMQSQQMPNHLQQMQMSGQVNQMTNSSQQIPQMQPQMHMTAQPTGQQQVVPGMHPQMQQGMSGVQPQYNQAVNQQPNPQSMISSVIPSSQQTMVSQQHNVPQYHTQQSQISQQGQTLPQEVLTGIAASHQAASMAANLQSLPSQPPGSTLPSNLQAINQQNAMHSIAQQGQSMPQGALQMMTNASQNMPMSLDANQAGMQLSVSDPIYLQSTNQMQMGQHMPQPQNMMPQQVSAGGQTQQHLQQQNQMSAMQYVMPQQQGMPNQSNVPNQQCNVSQANMQNVNQQGNIQSMGLPSQGQPLMQTMVNQVPHPQNIPMSMQQSHPASMQGTVHGVATSVVQSQTNMQPGMQGMSMANYGSQAGVSSMPQNVMPVMSHTSMNQQMDTTQAISGTSSPVVSLGVSSGAYAMPVNAMEGQNFGSPVSAVVSHVVNSLVNSSVGLTACDSVALEVNETGKSGDTGDGKDDPQQPGVSEDESISGLALALGGSAASSPAEPEPGASRATSPAPPPPNDRPHHTRSVGREKRSAAHRRPRVSCRRAAAARASRPASGEPRDATSLAARAALPSPIPLPPRASPSLHRLPTAPDASLPQSATQSARVPHRKRLPAARSVTVDALAPPACHTPRLVPARDAVRRDAGAMQTKLTSVNYPSIMSKQDLLREVVVKYIDYFYPIASGTSAVAIDNKIEQAMDLVKSHLMFAVREEVEVLKERIAELMERITQLEVENTYLRAHASQDTLAQLPAAAKPAPAPHPPAGPSPPVS